MPSSFSPEMTRLVEQAARRLADGRIVAFPTETVYGLGADAENPAALAKIFAIKGRPASHPVIVHLSPEADVSYWAKSVPAQARILMQVFWPGPLTLILPRADHISSAISGGQDSIGLRCPSHPVAQTLLRQFAQLKSHGQGGVAGPSANKFGQVSPTQAEHVRTEFPELSSADLMVLDGGPAQVGIESTIVDVSRVEQGIGPVVLRPGHVTAAQISEALGIVLSLPDGAAPRVSGSLKAHYAPRTPLFVLPLDRLLEQVDLAASGPGRVAAVVFDSPSRADSPRVDWCVASADPDAYAQGLYALLRHLDRRGYTRILLQQPPRDTSWQAVNDRIGRAAAAFS